MRCSRSSDDQFDDYDGELQHLVVHHGGGHQAEGGGGVSYLTHMFLAPTGSQGEGNLYKYVRDFMLKMAQKYSSREIQNLSIVDTNKAETVKLFYLNLCLI